MSSIVRKIPLNPKVFGDFKRGQRLKSGLIYFWFRSQTSYDVDNDIEYYPFKDNQPYNNLFYISIFKYGKNQITSLLEPLFENNLIVINKELNRYEFPQSSFSKNGEWTLIKLDLLYQLVQWCLTEDNTNRHCGIILTWGYLHNKFNLFGLGQHIFCYKDINTYLGYDDKSKTMTGKRIITILEDNELIKDIPSNDSKGKYQYLSYRQLLEVSEDLDDDIIVVEEKESIVDEQSISANQGIMFHLSWCGDRLFSIDEIRELIVNNNDPLIFIETRLLELPENYQKVIDSGLAQEFYKFFKNYIDI